MLVFSTQVTEAGGLLQPSLDTMVQASSEIRLFES